jgi:hypothetical protein
LEAGSLDGPVAADKEGEHADDDSGNRKHAVIFARNGIHRYEVRSREVAESGGVARRDY